MLDFCGTPTLETNRLILRRMRQDDTQIVFDRWLSDERISDHRISPAHKNVLETKIRVEKIVSGYDSKKFCYWGIELKDSHDLIGEIDLYDFDHATGNCEVSYSIGYD